MKQILEKYLAITLVLVLMTGCGSAADKEIMTAKEFQKKMDGYTEKLTELFAEGNALQTEILEQLKKVKYEDQKS